MIAQRHERSRARDKGRSATDGAERMSLSPARRLSQGVRLVVVTAVLIAPLIALLIALAPAATETLNITDKIKVEAWINDPPPENSKPDTSIKIDEPQLIDKGKDYTRHRNPDGSYTIAISSGTMNYYNGKDWDAIDTRIVDISKTEGNRTISGRSTEVLGDEYRYVMEKAGYHVYFPEMLTDAPIRFAVGSHEFSFKTSSVGYACGERSRTNGENNFISPRSTAANPSGNIIIYPNVFTDGIDVDAEYSLYKTGLKEFWILKSKPKPPEDPDAMLGFNTTINYDSDMYIDGKLILPGEEPLLTSSEIEFRDKNGETVFRLPRPYALDAKQEHVFCTYEIQKIDGEILLKNLVPWSWLDDSERTYPVRVDASPETLSAGFSVAIEGGTAWWTGGISSGDWHGLYQRSGIDFNTTVIPDTATITKVELKLYNDDEYGEGMNNDVAKMTSTAETYYNANNYSGFAADVDGNEYLSNSYGFYGSGSYHTVELLAAARTDLEDQLGADWFSVGFTGTTEVLDTGRDFHTHAEANPPQIIVTYTAPGAVTAYQVQNILADLSLDTECGTVKVALSGPETIEMIESASAGCSGETKEDKVKFTVATTAETDLLTTYFDNGGYASSMMVTCQSSGNEINFKSKAIGGIYKIYLYEANPVTGALIGDPLDTHTETVTLNVAHVWTDLTGLEGVVSSGNTFAFKMSFTPADATSSDIETKFGAYGVAGKQLLFNIYELACKFLYRRPITIDHTNVGTVNSGELPATGFPVLVSVIGDWLKTTTVDSTNGRIEDEDGDDIIFRASDGVTQLYHEIEEYDGTNGILVAWVRVDSLSMGPEDTTIYMYYGNSCITSPTEEPENVWDTNYKGVWHLKEDPSTAGVGGIEDSTSNGHNGTDQGGMDSSDQVPGVTDGSFDFEDPEYVDFGDVDDFDLGTSNLTVSLWLKGQGVDQAFVSKSNYNGPYTGIYIYKSDSQNSYAYYTGGYNLWNEDGADGLWHHLVAVREGTGANQLKLYLDGSQVTTGTDSRDLANDRSFMIHRWHDLASANSDAVIDEVRVSSTDRDLDWIRTCYNNQVWPNKAVTPVPDPSPNPASGFFTVGNEEFNVATAVDLISFTATGQDESVLVSWETAQEIDNLGFNLYRSTEVYGTYTRLNRRLMPGLISSISGQQYTYTDMDVTRSVLYYYMLEDVDLCGTRTMHGPVCVDWDNDGIPDDCYEELDDDTDTDTGEEEPEVSIPDSGFDELDLDLSDWTPSSSSASWVKLASFRARQEDEGIALEWETSFEVDILGFHVYREVEGKFYRVTADLVPGSVFRVGAGRELPAGQSYRQSYVYWDGLSEGRGDELYWLDSVELNGGRASFGPIRPEIYGRPVAERIRARFRSIGKRQVSRARALGNIRALREELSTKPAKTYKSQVTLVQAVPEKFSGPRLLPGEEQRALAAQPGVKIYIKEDGWYRVGEPELVAAGLSSGVDPRYLQLYADGEEQCLMVTGGDDGRFDPEDAIEFYGTGLDTPFTDAHVYWLVVGSRPGRRLDTPFTDIRLNLGRRLRIPRGLRGRGAPLSFPFSVELKERTFYFAALTDGERENFFGSVISTEPVDQLLTVAHPDPSSPEDALLEVVLQGGTDSTHQVRILFNYVEVGEVIFSGQEQWRAEIEVPHDLLLEGENVVTLAAQGGSMDVSLVDYIRLTYWRTYTADEDALRFRASGGEWISIGGFSSPEIQVRDITDPMRLLKVRGKVMTQDSGYAITIKVPGGGERSLMAFTGHKIKRPAGIAANLVSSWHELSQGAEVIIIGHRDLLGDVRFLKELREQQGWSVVLVDVEDLYDEFNFGAKSPWALRNFLAQAYAYWNPQPRFVVLVGDASYDPRNYLGFGEFDLVPTKFVDTEYLKTASDDWFVDFNNDELPEMAVGRLPVESAEEAAAVVSKIISYEEGASGLMNEALLVADINDFFNFEGASEEVGSLLPGDMTISEIFRGQSPTARSDLLDSLNQGQLLVNYIGHGSAKIWKGNLLTSLDAWNLTNSPYLPFLVSMTCLNGFFQDPYSESLAETFLKAEGGGAVAVWSSSGLTDPEGQIVMNKELIHLLFNGQGLTIGEAIMRAKQVVTDADIRKTWILLGDPTLQIK